LEGSTFYPNQSTSSDFHTLRFYELITKKEEAQIILLDKNQTGDGENENNEIDSSVSWSDLTVQSEPTFAHGTCERILCAVGQVYSV
jgi:hypothetical protein